MTAADREYHRRGRHRRQGGKADIQLRDLELRDLELRDLGLVCCQVRGVPGRCTIIGCGLRGPVVKITEVRIW